jgi:hypothetical protein
MAKEERCIRRVVIGFRVARGPGGGPAGLGPGGPGGGPAGCGPGWLEGPEAVGVVAMTVNVNKPKKETRE